MRLANGFNATTIVLTMRCCSLSETCGKPSATRRHGNGMFRRLLKALNCSLPFEQALMGFSCLCARISKEVYPSVSEESTYLSSPNMNTPTTAVPSAKMVFHRLISQSLAASSIKTM